MAEIKLKKKLIYSGEVFASLVGRGWGCTEISNFLREFMEVDAVEVVRCKDCRLWLRNGGFTKAPTGHCFCHDIETTAHDFCSYGERRPDG